VKNTEYFRMVNWFGINPVFDKGPSAGRERCSRIVKLRELRREGYINMML